jgi:hypothetical protein
MLQIPEVNELEREIARWASPLAHDWLTCALTFRVGEIVKRRQKMLRHCEHSLNLERREGTKKNEKKKFF